MSIKRIISDNVLTGTVDTTGNVIASVTNTAPAANPFLLSIGIHYEIDTLGSRERGTK